ncbi:MAG: hypothetical protein M3071_14060 [Actinomycetota bacterium]|nr:hypothetical protein [Actinomycetota bacterium]
MHRKPFRQTFVLAAALAAAVATPLLPPLAEVDAAGTGNPALLRGAIAAPDKAAGVIVQGKTKGPGSDTAYWDAYWDTAT